MSKVPADLRFLKSHEWARLEADGTVTVGISDHAQQALGDQHASAGEEGKSPGPVESRGDRDQAHGMLARLDDLCMCVRRRRQQRGNEECRCPDHRSPEAG